MTETTHLEHELDLCTMSPEGFSVLTPKILETINKDNWYYRDFFLEKLTIIITSKTNSPVQRFYALYLLFKSTETADRIYYEKIAKCDDLLNFVGRTAQHDVARKIALDARGHYFFSSKPSRSESKIGVNFVRLCLETLIQWQQRCDEKTPGNPCYIFSFYGMTIKKKLLVPSYYHFINRNFNLSQDIANWDFGNSLPLTIEESTQKRTKTRGNGDEKANDRSCSIENCTDESMLSEDKGLILTRQMPNNSGLQLNSTAPQRRTSTAFLGTMDPKYKTIADNTIESPLRVGKPTAQSLLKEVAEDRKVAVNQHRYNKLMGLIHEPVQNQNQATLKKVSSLPCGLTEPQPHYYSSYSHNNITSLGDIKEENAQDVQHYDTLNPYNEEAISSRSLRTLKTHPTYSPLKTPGSSQMIVFSRDDINVPSLNDIPNEVRHTPVRMTRPQDKIAMELLEIQNSIMKSQTRTTKDTLGSIKSIPEIKEKFERPGIKIFTTIDVKNNNAYYVNQATLKPIDNQRLQPQQQSYSAAIWGSKPTSLGEIVETDLRKVKSNQEGVKVESKRELHYAKSSNLDDKQKGRDDRVRRLFAAYAENVQKESVGSSKNIEPEIRNSKISIHRAQSGNPYMNQGNQEQNVLDEKFLRSTVRHESEKTSLGKSNLQKQRALQENPQGRVTGLISLLSSTVSAWQGDD